MHPSRNSRTPEKRIKNKAVLKRTSSREKPMVCSEFLSRKEASHDQSLSAQTKQRRLVRLYLPKMLCNDCESYHRPRAFGVRPEACLRQLAYSVVSRCGRSHRQAEARVKGWPRTWGLDLGCAVGEKLAYNRHREDHKRENLYSHTKSKPGDRETPRTPENEKIES